MLYQFDSGDLSKGVSKFNLLLEDARQGRCSLAIVGNGNHTVLLQRSTGFLDCQNVRVVVTESVANDLSDSISTVAELSERERQEMAFVVSSTSYQNEIVEFLTQAGVPMEHIHTLYASEVLSDVEQAVHKANRILCDGSVLASWLCETYPFEPHHAFEFATQLVAVSSKDYPVRSIGAEIAHAYGLPMCDVLAQCRFDYERGHMENKWMPHYAAYLYLSDARSAAEQLIRGYYETNPNACGLFAQTVALLYKHFKKFKLPLAELIDFAETDRRINRFNPGFSGLMMTLKRCAAQQDELAFHLQSWRYTPRPAGTCSDENQLVLGINAFGHDPGLAVIDSRGVPVLILEESRFNGKKDTKKHLPFCFDYLIDHTPYTHFKSICFSVMESESQVLVHFPHLKLRGVESLTKYLSTVISWEAQYIVPHHRAHVESSFRASGFEKALVVSCDGHGGLNSLQVATGDTRREEVLVDEYAIRYQDFSFGLLYDRITAYLGYRRDNVSRLHAGKIMGLSSYGEPVYRHLFDSVFPTLNVAGLSCPIGNTEFCSALFHELPFPPFEQPSDIFDPRQADLAASLQSFLEEHFIEFLKELKQRFPSFDNLCLAGGIAMNSLQNGRILDSGLFNELFVQPMSSDCGQALGAALYGVAQRCPRANHRWTTAYLGGAHEDDEAELSDLLTMYQFPVSVARCDNPEERIANLIMEGKIVGLFQGQQEVGARALGNRSILCLPAAKNRDLVNSRIKFRECWRPFAPIVQEEFMEEYFVRSRPEYFMTTIYSVADAYQQELDGITHVDGTARVQSVNRDQNPRVYGILNCLKDNGQAPVLLNTSFNINGQPVVRTVYDAIVTFLHSGLDYLSVGPVILGKTQAEHFPNKYVTPVDRVLADVLRMAERLSVILLPATAQTMHDLDTCLDVPSIRLRKKSRKLILNNLYIQSNLSGRLEVDVKYGDVFSRIDRRFHVKPPTFAEPLLVFIGTATNLHFSSFTGGGLSNLREHLDQIDNALILDFMHYIAIPNKLSPDHIYFVDSNQVVFPAKYLITMNKV